MRTAVDAATFPAATGQPATATHWLRGLCAHGSEAVHIYARLYWPLSDPRPSRGWWW